MKDFYFKVQINMATSVRDKLPTELIRSILWDYFNNVECIMTDIEVEDLSKKEYFER